MMDNIVTLDLFNRYIFKINYEGKIQNKLPLNISKKGNEIVYYDYFFDNIYLYSVSVSDKVLYKIDVSRGELESVCIFNGANPQNIKVIGNKVYFLSREESGYNKLYCHILAK
jgi:hypothetical protein